MEENTKNSMCKTALWAIIAIFIFSLVTMLFTISIATKVGAIPGISVSEEISDKYDKGQSLEKAEKTGKPYIVWFYTDWCGYCKMFATTYGEINKNRDIKKKYAIAYVNCDSPSNKQYLEKFKVQGFPTVFLVDGERIERIDNNILFAPNALEELKAKMEEFIQK